MTDIKTTSLYPLRFQPIFRRYLWGGRRLAEVLHKPIGDATAAESWEIVDHEEDQSVVAEGHLQGMTLRQLIAGRGDELLGRHVYERISAASIPAHLRHRFPLLLKFLDANQHLSVQVHPDDAFGATLSPPDLGKTEAWYVMHADPGSKIFAGLKEGITREDFEAAVGAGETESTLHRFEPKAGDCIFIRAGTLHAIGAGLLIAEIQQASNTTFRVFDWNRVDKDGRSRPLHLEQAMEVTNFSLGPVNPLVGRALDANQSEELVSCEKFKMSRIRLRDPIEMRGEGRFRILAVVKGELTITGDPSNSPLQLGQTCLLPACLERVGITPMVDQTEILEIHVP
jgi:mannose-6-phosphate isomerase